MTSIDITEFALRSNTSGTILGVSSVDKPTSKTADKESDMPHSLFDNKNTSDKDNEQITFAEFDFTHSEHDLSANQNDVNTLDKKADLSTDKGVDKIEEKDKSNKHVDNQNEKESKKVTPSTNPSTYDIFSYKKHSMDYFTVDGVILRTGYADKKYWYILVIKELLDNAIDFLWKYYLGYSDTSIRVYH